MCNYWHLKNPDFHFFPVLKGLRKIGCFLVFTNEKIFILRYQHIGAAVRRCSVEYLCKNFRNFTWKHTWWRPFLGDLSCSLYQNKSLWTDFFPHSLERFSLIQYLFLPLFLILHCHLLLVKSITTEFVAEGAKCYYFLVDKLKVWETTKNFIAEYNIRSK